MQSDNIGLKARQPSMAELSTPVSNISAFCRSAFDNVLPDEFFGIGDDQEHNKRTLMRSVDRFVRLRRFESFSLHDVSQGMKVGASLIGPVSSLTV